MRLLFLGDVVGRSGRAAVIDELPKLRARYKLDFVAVNGENAAGGFGITEAILEELLAAGADVVTLGNHTWDQKETLVFIERQDRLLRPINYPPGTPGKGVGLFKARNGADVLVINAMGLIFMPDLACPFRAWIVTGGLRPEARRGRDRDRLSCRGDQREAAFGYYVDDGRCLVGTHTHAPTADERGAAEVPPSSRYRHVRGLRIGAGHGPWGAAQPVPHQDRAWAIRAGHGPGDHLGAGGGDRRLDRPCAAHGRVAARWCFGTYRAAVLGRVRKRVRVF